MTTNYPASAWARRCPPRWLKAPHEVVRHTSCPFSELAEGPYFVVASMLDASALCMMDAACRCFRTHNNANAHVGPWRALGSQKFCSLELEHDGAFEQPVRKCARIDWKGRFHHFRKAVATFMAPFGGSRITAVTHADEVAYFRSRLCTDKDSCPGVYLEVDVQQNPDNLSLALVDFEAGGCSSITFSPDTGAVIRERKVQEVPRKVEGAYIQSLPSVPPETRFLGRMGVYLHQGRISFFRRSAAAIPNRSAGVADANELGPWETTGFISDLSWAEGSLLTPCLAFREEGAYNVQIVYVGAHPPVPTKAWTVEDDAAIGWSGFDWEVEGQNDVEGDAMA